MCLNHSTSCSGRSVFHTRMAWPLRLLWLIEEYRKPPSIRLQRIRGGAVHNPLDLSGKLVLVTGASSGIGRATAVVLSRMGARLILSGRRADALDETLAATPPRPCPTP